MSVSDSTEQLIQQIQNAHRISVAFYRRILPVLDEIAGAFDCRFVEWYPLHTSRPCRGSSQPSDYWAWDFVPLFASSHVYWRSEGRTTRVEDLGIEFDLYVDDNIKPDRRKALGLRNNQQPGAISMETGRAVLEVFLYRPTMANKASFSKNWEKGGAPSLGGESMQDVGGNLKAIAFEIPLEKVVNNYQVVIDRISQYTD